MADVLPERFWDKVERSSEDGCWNWLGTRNSQGYGTFRLNGRMCRATRLVTGALDDQVVLHSCDNPACVNPAHLRLGTQKENVADCKAKGRRAVCVGECNNFSKLTERDVKEIRAWYAAITTYPSGRKEYGKVQRIIERYGITDANLYSIVTGKTWRHV